MGRRARWRRPVGIATAAVAASLLIALAASGPGAREERSTSRHGKPSPSSGPVGEPVQATAGDAGGPAGGSDGGPPLVADPASLVDPFVGTGSSSVPGTDPGDVDEFPAATLPFGMVQWGPDTSPDRPFGGGYAYRDASISGFSLTHLSGPGCAIYGDIPILPMTGPIGTDPDTAVTTFSHATESAAPGRYAVTIGTPGIGVQLTVTTRAGLGSFTFPATTQADLLVKGDGSADGVDHNTVDVVGDDEVTGSTTSGHFCQTLGTYTIYFALQFDRPFQSAGSWRDTTVTPGATSCAASSTSGLHALLGGAVTSGGGCGAWVTFDTTHDPTVRARVGVSFTSVAEARANLAAEMPGWDLGATERQATADWNGTLSRIAVGGGTAEQQRVFYTALYHSLLHPDVFSDVDGSYRGFDGSVHHAGGHAQYANFSEWDIYRSEVPLLALLAPAQTSDMMQSLVADAAQSGWLPKEAVANADSAQMNGDSADPVLAAAYAFGARAFDLRTALADMIKGATVPAPGSVLYPERQDLSEYEARGWIERGAVDRTSIPYTVGGSETLEYAIDDFAISRFAIAVGDGVAAAMFLERSGNWQNLFNPATRHLAARDGAGTFAVGPAFQPSAVPGIGQDGWEEGNSIQYTWSVPQDLHALFADMGGNAVAAARLDQFFAQLNAGRRQPYDWAGNEPGLGIPWEYDYAGAPWKSQAVVRRIATTLYNDSPGGEPGNDDLGALSSWEVWAAIGLYPETPGTGDVVLASPMFPRVVIAPPGRPALVIDAPGASGTDEFIAGAALQLSNRCPVVAWTRPWLAAGVVQEGGTLRLAMQSTPNVSWGAAPGDAPPSFPSVGAVTTTNTAVGACALASP